MSSCQARKDAIDCELACRFAARQCQAAQGNSTSLWKARSPKLGAHQTLLIDLAGRRPLSSSDVQLKVAGGVTATAGQRRFSGYHSVPPGGSIDAVFTLPKKLRELELVVAHSPDPSGLACFVTITVDDHTVAGRYSPPRSKTATLREEVWNLTPHLEAILEAAADADDGSERISVRLFIYNNREGSSLADYRIGSVMLNYRALSD